MASIRKTYAMLKNVLAGLVESGRLFELSGRSLDENDPRVIAESCAAAG